MHCSTENWTIYQDNARLLWDAMEDDNDSAIGSNWYPTTKKDAERFIAKMKSPESIADGWSRGHWSNSRF